MIDLDSDNTQPNNNHTQAYSNFVDLVGDDEWMSDDNIDNKIENLRKQIRNHSRKQNNQK